MTTAGDLGPLLRHDRRWIVVAILVVAAAAWWHLAVEAQALARTGVCTAAGLVMCGPELPPWAGTALIALFLMWAEMMAAMMLPSAAPMILTFAALNRRRREQSRPFVPTSTFVSGYLLVWTGFSLAAAAAQWSLHGAGLLSPNMVTTSPLFAGALLLGAGLFQFTPLKRACLVRCQSPLTFILTAWEEGKRGAWRMGLRHGLYCTGCCWFLMALLFVAGVMNLWWVAAIAAYVVVEKLAPRGLRLGELTGTLLLAWGGWTLVAG